MTDEQQRQAVPGNQIQDQVQHLGPDTDVQGRDGLVGDQHSRVGGQRSGDRDPLALTPAELVWKPPGVTGLQTHLG